jgi:hypothetical protein
VKRAATFIDVLLNFAFLDFITKSILRAAAANFAYFAVLKLRCRESLQGRLVVSPQSEKSHRFHFSSPQLVNMLNILELHYNADQ